MSEQIKVMHPERQVGQQWRSECSGTAIVGTLVSYTDGHWKVKQLDGHDDVWADARWKMSAFTMILVALAPSPVCRAPDRMACHPDCGIRHTEHANTKNGNMELGWTTSADGRIFCTIECCKANVAPLAAAPVTVCPGCIAGIPHSDCGMATAPVTTHANNCADHGGYTCTCGAVKLLANDLGTGANADARRPDQPTVVSAPVPVTCRGTCDPSAACDCASCWHVRRGNGPCTGPVAMRTIGCGPGTSLPMCDGHMLYREGVIVRQMEVQTGVPLPPNTPERLPRAKMAHAAGLDDEELMQ